MVVEDHLALYPLACPNRKYGKLSSAPRDLLTLNCRPAPRFIEKSTRPSGGPGPAGIRAPGRCELALCVYPCHEMGVSENILEKRTTLTVPAFTRR
jgi:hypothetical protein